MVFVTIVQIIRIQTISNLANYLDSALSIMWSIIESNTGIMITCIPTLAPLVRYFSDKSRTSSWGDSRKRESPYPLRSWRNRRDRMRTLGRNTDHETNGTGANEQDSTERILNPEGITKRTDAIVIRQTIGGSNMGQSGESL
ncbi:hypothetical protein F5B20DRAFT_557658 [Whalleya microplaca]|nr:hypothetical protein F5B20DRAFT_557658 [Whalleya microplaca]